MVVHEKEAEVLSLLKKFDLDGRSDSLRAGLLVGADAVLPGGMVDIRFVMGTFVSRSRDDLTKDTASSTRF